MRALVVFLKGINVGGHRTFRPSELARRLMRFDVTNIGAAGTFVVRKPVTRRELRTEILQGLPFEAEVMICSGSDLVRLASSDPFAGHVPKPDIVQFVSVMARRRDPPARLPLNLPGDGAWGLKVLGGQGRFVFGLYRRQMKAIRYLGQLEKLFGAPLTTRSWSTISAVAQMLR